MVSDEDLREVEQLTREAEQLNIYLERSDISSADKLARALEVRERHLKIASERRRRRSRIELAPLPPLLLQNADASPTAAKGEIMTYEQMEKTMQFLLERQVASSEWQKQFEENLAQINGTLSTSAEWQRHFEKNFARRNAESAEWQQRFEENFARRNTESTEWQQRFEENLAQINAALAASTEWQRHFEENIAQINAALAISAKWQKQAEDNFGRLMGDIVGYSTIFDNINLDIEKLTDRLSIVAEHLKTLTDNVNTLSTTVKNMIKGGSNGNQQL